MTPWNPNQQRELTPQERDMQLQNQALQDASLTWQPYAMGGGHWIVPPVVRLLDDDVERIARRVVDLLNARGAK